MEVAENFVGDPTKFIRHEAPHWNFLNSKPLRWQRRLEQLWGIERRVQHRKWILICSKQALDLVVIPSLSGRHRWVIGCWSLNAWKTCSIKQSNQEHRTQRTSSWEHQVFDKVNIFNYIESISWLRSPVPVKTVIYVRY